MALKAAGLQTHIWNNDLKSIVILGTYPLIFIGLLWLSAFAYSYILLSHSTQAIALAGELTATYWLHVIAGVGVWFIIAFFWHTKMIRHMSQSHPVTRNEEPELYNLLENLCIAQGITMPRLEVIETHARNAFASGIGPKTYTVTVTRGLMTSLAKDELEAVLAHELAHILNHDVRLLIITIIFTGMLGFLTQMAWNSLRYSALSRGSSRNNGQGKLLILVIAIILSFGYFLTILSRFALSRKREYMADAGAVAMTKNPEAMMRALLRISGKDRLPSTNEDIAMMYVENRKKFLGLFHTHPPIPQRVNAIARMTGAAAPDAQSLPPVRKQERYITQGKNPKNPWITQRHTR